MNSKRIVDMKNEYRLLKALALGGGRRKRRPGAHLSMLMLTLMFLGLATSVSTQTMMPLPAHATAYTGYIRGYWFQAPTDFVIVGMRVPTDASTSQQCIQVMRMTPAAPPPTSCSSPPNPQNFVTLGYWPNVPGTNIIPANILVHQGDYIAILGSRWQTAGNFSSINSYGNGPAASTIFGLPVTLNRLLFQNGIMSFPADCIWTSTGSIGRVEMYYALPGSGYNDAGIASIDSPQAFCAGTHPVTVTLKNFGANQITSATINWKINGVPQTAYPWTGLLDTLNNSTREASVNLGSRNFLVGVPYTIQAWTTNPNGVPDTINTNDTSAVTVKAALAGTFTIGGVSPNYANFTAAVDDLVNSGVCGPVTFNVAAGTYTEAITIPEISGASSVNTITFNGGTGNAASRILTHSTPTSYSRVVTLDGADYVRFRNLTVRPTDASYGYGFLFTNSADYNEISNCRIEMPTSSTSAYHIGICGNTMTSYSSSGDFGNYNLIQDNTITGGSYGIRWYGSGSSDYTTATGNQFIGNTITDWYSYGFYLYYPGGQLDVKHNRAIQRSTGTYTTTSGYAYYIYYPNDGPEVSYNYGFAAYSPFYIYRPNYYYASTSNRAKVYNNMGATNGTSTNYGLYVSYPRYTDCVYNTVFMKTTGTAYGMYVYGETTAYDNKFANNWIALEGSGTFYAQYQMTSGSAIDFSLFDNNGFYRNGTGTDYYRWQGTSYSTLAAMQAASPGFNQNSVYGNPYFVSLTDVHSRSHVGYQAGVSIAGFTDDYDGEPRGISPCIGADEYPAPPPEFDISIADMRINYAPDNWARLEDPAMNNIDVVLVNSGLSTNPAGITVVYKVGGMPANETDGVAQIFNPTWVANTSKVTFTQPLTGLAPTAALTVYARAFWAQDQNGANNSGSDTRKIDLTKVHGNENFNSMIAPAFTDYAGLLDYPWMVQDMNGGATWRLANGVGMSASIGLEYPGDAQPGDDWVFSPGAVLEGGASYRMAFQLKSVTGAPQKLEVAFGTSPDPGSMTTFAVFSNFTNTSFLSAKQIAGGMDPFFNTPEIDGPYYLGFRVTSNAGAGAVVLDDIVLDDNPSPPPKIGFGLPGDPLITFIDTPARKIQLQANYKTPGLIIRTYEVANMTNIYGADGDFLWDVETTTPWITLTKATPEPTLQGYNFTPPRPRQFQDFTMTVNPNGLAPGLHVGQITFYGILFNDDFPPPAFGLVATNEPLTIDVELRIVNAGSKGGPPYEEAPMGLMTAGNTYNFIAPITGTPIATVEVTSGVINSMTIRVYPNQLPLNLARMLYVKRYWQITHTGTGWMANITFPYTDQEATMVNDRNQLRGVRQAVPQGRWEDPIMGTSSASDPVMNLVKVFDFNELNIGGNIALAQPYFIYGKVGDDVPTSFGLEQNYPNPFNPTTTINFNVAEERAVRIVVYNSLGMEVAELVNDLVPAGRYSAQFDASTLPTGTYICRMMAGDVVQSIQMVLSK